MRKAPSLLNLSADRCSKWGWGTRVSFRCSAPCRPHKQTPSVGPRCYTFTFILHYSMITLQLHKKLPNVKTSSVSHLVGHVVKPVQVRMNHSHQLLQRLRLELTHGKDALVQPRAGAGPQSFLETKAVYLDYYCFFHLQRLHSTAA